MPPDDRYFEIEKSFGAERCLKGCRSFKEATNLVEAITRTERIDCDFERLDGYLYCLPGQDQKDLERELFSAGRAGVAVERLPRVPGLSCDTGACIRFSRRLQFTRCAIWQAWPMHASRRCRVYCGTRALDIQGNSGRLMVTTSGSEIRTPAVVVATNTPFNDRVVMHTKQSGYRTYVVGIEVPRDSLPRLLLWDTGDPYYYVRLAPGDPASAFDILIVGGGRPQGWPGTHPERRWEDVERWVRERFPMAGSTIHRWSGQVMEPADPLGVLRQKSNG